MDRNLNQHPTPSANKNAPALPCTALILTTRSPDVIKSLTYTLGDAEVEILFQSHKQAALAETDDQKTFVVAMRVLRSHTLAPREKEVLYWAAEGKTSWETANVLGLSEKTVKHYLSNARKRLAVQNTKQAIALCMSERAFVL